MATHSTDAPSLNEGQQRFEIQLESGMAVLEFRRTGQSIVFTHTEVPKPAEGQGVGASLVKAGLDYAREQGLSVVPLCRFVEAYMRRHPETMDLMNEDYKSKMLRHADT